MNDAYGRDIDLNLLRVFAVVAETGSVTAAAGKLYLTQPAISAALRRLTAAVGAPLFARQGRGLALTTRGQRLFAEVQPRLKALIDAALTPAGFDPRTSDRTFRLGMSDASESWILPALMGALAQQGPGLRIIAVPVHFRNVAAALNAGTVEAAITVADELPAAIRRQRLYTGSFVCLFDPAHARLKRTLTKADYFARDHIVVSYNGDLRGIVEDALQKQRRVRCSVASFANVGALVDGTAMLATVPEMVAQQIRGARPHLQIRPLPFRLPGAFAELLWPARHDDDEALAFVRQQIVAIVARMG